MIVRFSGGGKERRSNDYFVRLFRPACLRRTPSRLSRLGEVKRTSMNAAVSAITAALR